MPMVVQCADGGVPRHNGEAGVINAAVQRFDDDDALVEEDSWTRVGLVAESVQWRNGGRD